MDQDGPNTTEKEATHKIPDLTRSDQTEMLRTSQAEVQMWITPSHLWVGGGEKIC